MKNRREIFIKIIVCLIAAVMISGCGKIGDIERTSDIKEDLDIEETSDIKEDSEIKEISDIKEDVEIKVDEEMPMEPFDGDVELMSYIKSGNIDVEGLSEKFFVKQYTPQNGKKLSFDTVDIEGNSIDDSLVSGNTITLLHFFDETCDYCKTEIPWYIDIYEAFKDKGVGVVGVVPDFDEGNYDDYSIPFPIIVWNESLKTEAEVVGDYPSMPFSVLVDSEGNILTTNKEEYLTLVAINESAKFGDIDEYFQLSDEEREEYYEFEGAQWDEYKDNCDKIPTLYDIAGIVTVIIDRLCTM